MAQLREAVFDLHPYVLEEAGLEAALRSFAQEAAARGRTCDCGSTCRYPAPHPHEQLVFSAARELLANVVRHARRDRGRRRASPSGTASSCSSSRTTGAASRRGGPAERLADGHIGLAAQRVRVEAAGGRMELLSAPGDGTRVEVRVP